MYHEQKLLNKALVVPIQYPSAVYGERQVMNGGRLHHHIDYRYLMPKILKGEPERDNDNIDWKKWPEDWPFTNEKIVKEYGEGKRGNEETRHIYERKRKVDASKECREQASEQAFAGCAERRPDAPCEGGAC